MEMGVDVLVHFGVAWRDIAWNIKIVVVGGYLLKRGEMGIVGNIIAGVVLTQLPCVDDTADVLGAKAVLVAVFFEALLGVNHENAFALGSPFLVEDDDAGWYAGAIKEIGWQTDNALDIMLTDNILSELGLLSTEEHAVRQDASATSRVGLHAADEMEQEGEVCTLGRR